MNEIVRLIGDIRYPTRFSLPFIGFEDKRLEWNEEQHAFVKSICEVFPDVVPVELAYADVIVQRLANKGGRLHELWDQRWPEQYRSKFKNYMSALQVELKNDTAARPHDSGARNSGSPGASAPSATKDCHNDHGAGAADEAEGGGNMHCCICLERVAATEWFQVTGHWSSEVEAPVHSMHHVCANQWLKLKKNCPLCKQRWCPVRWTDQQQAELLNLIERKASAENKKDTQPQTPQRPKKAPRRSSTSNVPRRKPSRPKPKTTRPAVVGPQPHTPKRSNASPLSRGSFSDPCLPDAKIARIDEQCLRGTKRSLLDDLRSFSQEASSSSSTSAFDSQEHVPANV